MKHIIILAGLASLIITVGESGASETPLEVEKAVFLITTKSGSGTGFACEYRNQQFVATNLHVIEEADIITVKSIAGDSIPLSGRLIACEDSDICLISIRGSFADKGIMPLHFTANAVEETKVNDDVLCLGNSLGNGVVTTTKGQIKAYGQPRIEITNPVVKGNSGGPILHVKSGKVVGLVTEAIINKLTFDELGVVASESKNSPVEEISYFGHRIDTAKNWSSTTISDYFKTSSTLAAASTGLANATLFLADKPGWENDKRLSEAWREYSKFVENAAAKTSGSVKVTDYVNEFGFIVRRDVRIRSKSVSDADYQAALDKFKRGVEWKIKSDQETLKRLRPIGYRQTDAKKLAIDFSDKVLALSQTL